MGTVVTGAVVIVAVGDTSGNIIPDSSSPTASTWIGKSGSVGGGVLERRRSTDNGVGLIKLVVVGRIPPVVFGMGIKPKPKDKDNDGGLSVCLNAEISVSKALNRSNDRRNISSVVGCCCGGGEELEARWGCGWWT